MVRVGHLSILTLVFPITLLTASAVSVQAGSTQANAPAPAPVRAVAAPVVRQAPVMQAPRQAGAPSANNFQGARVNAPNAAPTFSPVFHSPTVQMGGQTTPAIAGSGVGAAPPQPGRFSFATPAGSNGVGTSANTTAPASVSSPAVSSAPGSNSRIVFAPAAPVQTTTSAPTFSTARPTTPMVQAPQQPTRITIAPTLNHQPPSAPNSTPSPTRITLTPIQPRQNQIVAPTPNAGTVSPTTPIVQASQQPTRISITPSNNSGPSGYSTPIGYSVPSGYSAPIGYSVPSGFSVPGGSSYTTSGYMTGSSGLVSSGYMTGSSGLTGSSYSSGQGYTTSGYMNGPSGLTGSSYSSGPGYTTSGYMNGPSGLTGSSYNSGPGYTTSGYLNGPSGITGNSYNSGPGYTTSGYTNSGGYSTGLGIPVGSGLNTGASTAVGSGRSVNVSTSTATGIVAGSSRVSGVPTPARVPADNSLAPTSVTSNSAPNSALPTTPSSNAGLQQAAVKGAQAVLNAAPVVGNAAGLARDVWTGQYSNVGTDIKQTQTATTNYLSQYMTPNSTLYNLTNVLDKPAGQAAVKGAQAILNAAPVVGNAAGLARDVWTGQYSNVGTDIKQTQTATTNYLSQYMTPNSTLYNLTNVLDKPAGQAAVKGAQAVLNQAAKLPSWLNSVLPQN